MLGNSSLQPRLTQQHKGLWEQKKRTNAGLPPALGAAQEEQACGNISTTPLFLILESLDYGCLLCSSFEPKLREGRTFVSIVFTLVLAQGLTQQVLSKVLLNEYEEPLGFQEKEDQCILLLLVGWLACSWPLK